MIFVIRNKVLINLIKLKQRLKITSSPQRGPPIASVRPFYVTKISTYKEHILSGNGNPLVMWKAVFWFLGFFGVLSIYLDNTV